MTIDIEKVKRRRDDGIESVARHADEVIAQWTRTALQFLRNYAMSHETFLAEDVRDAASVFGIVEPHDGRAWGHVLRSGRRDGVIEPIGWAPAKSSNLSAKVLWRSLIYKRAA